MNEMGLTEYENALRLGKKRYQQAIGKEETPYLIALDEIIKEVEISIADAFLKYVELFSYPVVKERNECQMKADLKK